MGNYFKIFLFIHIFFLKIFKSYCECDKNTPILTRNDGCQLRYCSKDEFDSGDCSIDNQIIKTQWLNDIILFNSEKFRYGSFAINSKQDMIFECSPKEATGKRLFYWLKKDGSFYFENEEGEKVPTKIITVKDGDFFPIRYESANFFVLLKNGNGKECLISISLWEGYTEYYDFEENEVSFVYTIDFTNYNIYTTISGFFDLESSSNENYYYYLYVGQQKADEYNYNTFFLNL